MIITGIVLSSKTKTAVPDLPKTEEASAGSAGGGAFASLKDAAFELCLPLILLIGFFTGLLTPLQVSAVSVIYAAIVEVVIKKDIAFREVPKVFAKAVPVIGGVLIILAMSSGLSSAFVDSGIPDKFAAWVENTLQSKIAFLLLLNLALLLIGTVIDMFSAIMVLLPLVVPLGDVFGIHPVHLGIIFILNLEAGFMTPPVGINLFLASSRFRKPIMQICWYVIPFFLVRLAVLLLVAYIPWFSTWLPSLIK
jgi:tripartite ATP-independent transporter DctM subunit